MGLYSIVVFKMHLNTAAVIKELPFCKFANCEYIMSFTFHCARPLGPIAVNECSHCCMQQGQFDWFFLLQPKICIVHMS